MDASRAKAMRFGAWCQNEVCTSAAGRSSLLTLTLEVEGGAPEALTAWPVARRSHTRVDPASLWRLRAAMAADRRFARRKAYRQWVRVLKFWTDNSLPDGERPVTLAEVHRFSESAIRSGS